ncbi:MAG: tRNA glutamyl-Q(34) synthetase GluQRS [Nitratireductor sp.]
MNKPVFRFAPSPNGRLHLGHAFSALLNQEMAKQLNAKFLLRIEDTDLGRCTPVLEQRMLEDLQWLGIEWDEEPLRQSDNIKTYEEVIHTLQSEGLVYPAFMSRSQIKNYIGAQEENGIAWPRDPDGSPLYPDVDKNLSEDESEQRIANGDQYALRLDMQKAMAFVGQEMHWVENFEGPKEETGTIKAKPKDWGDIILSRKDSPASYHLACVTDDAMQGITHVVRGRDLFWSTSVHLLLQALMGFPTPQYFHHDLILDENNRKLSKSNNDTSIAELRSAGTSQTDIKKMIGLI